MVLNEAQSKEGLGSKSSFQESRPAPWVLWLINPMNFRFSVAEKGAIGTPIGE